MGDAKEWGLRFGMLAALLLGGCASPPPPTACTVASLPAVPEVVVPPSVMYHRGGSYKVGGPYRIGGVLYTPTVDYRYDRVGRASWYGRSFHHRRTANGERYDQDGLTAAHQTLPLPSVVRVTNLENGRSLILRVNDRGPFVRGRIIDVSRRAARLLRFHRKGTTRVRVQVLEKESREAAAELGAGG